MKTSRVRFSLSMLAVTVAVLMVACGGSDEPETSQAQSFVAQMATAPPSIDARKRALAGTEIIVDAKAAFDWAEYAYPDLFPKVPAPLNVTLPYQGVIYTVRGYANGNYLGVTATGDVYGLGPFTSQQLTRLGNLSEFAAQIRADACKVYPGSCPGPAAGPLNECTDPAAEALPTGFRTSLVYVLSGTLTGEQTIESVIDGPSTFEGQSAIKITSTTSGTGTFEDQTIDMSTTVESYQQLGADGVTKTLGALVQMTIGGFPFSSSKTVYAPPRENLEFHIAEGKTGTITSSATTTTIVPPGATPVAANSTETFTFQTKEQKTVLAGTFATCRYRTDGVNASTYDTTWYIVGKGVPALVESTVNGVVTDRQELKSGTYNGTPL